MFGIFDRTMKESLREKFQANGVKTWEGDKYMISINNLPVDALSKITNSIFILFPGGA